MDLRSDRRGRVPFAVVGVLVLLSASGAGVYLGVRDPEGRAGSDSAALSQRAAVRACNDELARIGAQAESAATASIALSLADGATEPPDALFSRTMHAWLSSRYPRGGDEARVNATLHSGILFCRLASVPSWDGSVSAAAPWEAEFLLDVSVECASGEARTVMRETVSGRVPARELFCKTFAGRLAASAEPGGRVDGMARALLSLLAEKRLAEGWGAGDDAPPLSEVLTPADVAKACEVALRSACVEACGVDPATGVRHASRYDAGDILLSELGETELDTSLILAQALSGMLDQLLLKYYDYLAIAGGVADVVEALETTVDWLESAWDRIAGDGTDAAMADAVARWIRGLAEEAGFDLSLLDLDEAVPLTDLVPPPATFVVENADGEPVSFTLQGAIPVDLLPYDVMADDRWGELFPALSSSYDSGAPSLSSMLDTLVEAMARSGASVAGLTLAANDTVPALSEIALALSEALSDSSLVRTAVLNAAAAFLGAQGDALRLVGEWVEENSPWMGGDNQRARESLGRSVRRMLDADPPEGLDAASRAALEAAVSDAVWASNGTLLEADYDFRIQDRVCLAAQRIASACAASGAPQAGWLVERLVDMVLEGAPGVPALADWIDTRVEGFGKSFIEAVAVRGADTWVDPSVGRVIVSRWSGQEETGMTLDAEFGGLGALAFAIVPPGGCDGSVHYTSPTEASPTPYTNIWQVAIAGEVNFTVSVGDASSSSSCRMGASFEATAASLWALDGVGYTPSATLAGDALDFFVGAFGDIVPPLTRAFDFAREAWDLLSIDVVPWLMAKGGPAVEALASLQLGIVGDLQDFLRSAASRALACVIETALARISGTTFTASLHGLPVSFRVLPEMPGPKRLLSVATAWVDAGGTEASVAAELLDLGNDTLDLVFTVDATGPSGWFAVAVDPLMESYDCMASLRGVVGGLGFDVVLPAVEQHRTLELSLQDIPGLGSVLSNIRIPNLGISADVDAGFSIDYAPPSATHVVVNEYEANPPIVDAGNETIELYNPLPVEVALDGWTVETLCGQREACELSGSIPPFSVVNVTFPSQALDNREDGVVLRNAAGGVVDETPLLRDETNSGMDWQRERDGWGRWVWAKSSLGRPQGAGDVNDSLLAPMREALLLTLNETADALLALDSCDIDSVMRVVKAMLDRFEDRVAAIIEGQVRRAALFVDLVVQDLTGSGGVGYRIEVAIDGQGCAAAFRYLSAQVRHLLGLATDPGSPEMAAAATASIVPHVSVSVSNLVELETPAELPGAFSGAQLPAKLQGRETISFNLPLVGWLAGRDWGPWVVVAGLRAMDFPARAAALVMPVDERLPVELWLVRAVFYEA